MANLVAGWVKHSAYVLISPEGKSANYTKYREITGLCEECGQPMDTHPKCEACHILTERDHFVYSSPYRRHDICSYCLNAWRRLDESLGRLSTWEEFLDPGKFRAGILNRRKATMRDRKEEVDSGGIS